MSGVLLGSSSPEAVVRLGLAQGAGRSLVPGMKEAIAIIKGVTEQDQGVCFVADSILSILNKISWIPSYETINSAIQSLNSEADKWNNPKKDELKSKIELAFSGLFATALQKEEFGKRRAIIERLAKMESRENLREYFDKIPQENHRDVALIFAEHNPKALGRVIRQLKIDGQTGLESAWMIAKRGEDYLFETIDAFDINDEQERFKILKLLIVAHPDKAKFKHIKAFSFQDPKHLFELAKLEAQGSQTPFKCAKEFAAIIANYRITSDEQRLQILRPLTANLCSKCECEFLPTSAQTVSFLDYFFYDVNKCSEDCANFLYYLTLENSSMLSGYIESLPISDGKVKGELLNAAVNSPRALCSAGLSASIKGAIESRCMSQLEHAWNAPVDPKLVSEANDILLRYSPMPDISEIAKSHPEKYQNIMVKRMAKSATLSVKRAGIDERQKKAISSWTDADLEIRSAALRKEPLTKEFLCKINQGVNTQNPGILRTEDINGGLYRQTAYMYPKFVSDQIDKFIFWVNEELDSCDKGRSNPLIVAALAYQRLVTIHGFNDGNGRTGRLVMDYILQRYNLPPATLGHHNAAIFAWKPINKTPSDAVQLVIEGVKTSYELLSN